MQFRDIKSTVDQHRATALKAAAAYATAKKTASVASRFAESAAHVWRIERDYATETFEAAVKVAYEHEIVVSALPKKQTTGNTHPDRKMFDRPKWTLLKGIAPGVQARGFHGVVEFRAFRSKDLLAVQAKVAEAEAETKENAVNITFDDEFEDTTVIYNWNAEKSAWQYATERTSRSFRSVLIPEELQTEIEEDLKRFTESRQRLVRLEMPWRRGYLLSGPPGTGKTSMSLAIAGALHFSLATLSLTDIESDGALKKCVSGLPARTVLVIEDIDANSVSHERNHNAAQDGALSLSGLLNSLDGFETPEGMVAILTTNHIERLDAALVRSGRMDRTFHLGYIEARELERLFEWFYEQPVPSEAPEITGAAEIAPADVAEIFKQHLNDPEGGWEAVLGHIDTQTTPLHAVA